MHAVLQLILLPLCFNGLFVTLLSKNFIIQRKNIVATIKHYLRKIGVLAKNNAHKINITYFIFMLGEL